MFRRLADFEKSWEYESGATLKLLRALTDASLATAVGPQHRTLGRLAWHVTQTIGEMMRRTGLEVQGPAEHAPVPAHAAEIAAAYEKAAASLDEEIRLDWSDKSLESEDDMYGQRWKRGGTLMALIAHQAHHRGQMTVLMRQAGLPVAGVYGPSREEWAGMGMEAPAI
ncbi:MAG: DinB family protein [Vicinamibacteria bacterium]